MVCEWAGWWVCGYCRHLDNRTLSMCHECKCRQVCDRGSCSCYWSLHRPTSGGHVWNLLEIKTIFHHRCNNYHEFHETCHTVTFYFMENDSKRCCGTIELWRNFYMRCAQILKLLSHLRSFFEAKNSINSNNSTHFTSLERARVLCPARQQQFDSTLATSCGNPLHWRDIN